jgi:hypothetical protein
MKVLIILSLFVLASSCARLELQVINQGTGAMKDLKIELCDQSIQIENLEVGASSLHLLQMKQECSPKIEYLKSNGQKVWASADVTLTKKDSGMVVLERFTLEGSEEFRVQDQRKGKKQR